MMKFQFDGDVDFFEFDSVAYDSALGETGMATDRARLQGIESGLGPRPSDQDRWSAPHSHQ